MPYKEPGLFAVVSWGAAATHWLARILNAHPDILCLHRLSAPLSRAIDAPINALAYMDGIKRAGLGYRLAGDCHGISRRELDGLRKRWPNRFRCAIVTRHPAPRIVSACALWKRNGVITYDVSRVKNAPAGFEQSAEKLMFFEFMTLINNVVDEIKEAPLYKMESLTREPEEVNRLIGYLSDGELEISDPGSMGFWRAGPSHAKRPGSAVDAFDAMPSWQQKAFQDLLSPAAKGVYEDLGYDFRFVR